MRVGVVGAGPAGCLAALRALEDGCEVSVYEEHDRPRVQCAGLISKSGLDRLKIDPKDSVLNKVSGAKIYPPKGEPFLIEGSSDKAYVVDRARFDSLLLESALDRGALFEKKRVRDLADMSCDLSVIATGTDYSLHRRLNFQAPEKFLVGAQYVMDCETDPSFVELHFNLPGFFSWVIPEGDLSRIGCAAYGNPTSYLDSFVRDLSRKGRVRGDVKEKNYGIIPVHDPRMKTQYPGAVLVGDAAGQVKASTGGGVVMGGLCARHILDPAYESSWRKEVGRELRMHLFIHRFLSRLSFEKKSEFFSLVAEHKHVLERKGDMDRATSLIPLFLDPRFSLRFLRFLR